MAEIEGREEILLKSLFKFYKEDHEYLKIVEAITSQKTTISLREIDYTVTNFGKSKPIIYKLKDGTSFNLHLDYKRQLKGYSKKNLDPFCRRQRIFIPYNLSNYYFINDSEINDYKDREDGIVTTVGQLNFFRWAINKEVIDYCFKNKEIINQDMEKNDLAKKMNKKNQDPKKRTRQLSKNTNSIYKEEKKIIIQFP